MINHLPSVAIIGGGPAGLMAAETIAQSGQARVTVFDRMPSVGRKFLMAGRGGLNLTHSEPIAAFLNRYGPARDTLELAIATFSPEKLVAWCENLGQPTFVGSSGRVFPRCLKASPLLRAWLTRLRTLGVTIQTRKLWQGWNSGRHLVFQDGQTYRADAVILALGGASWPGLGSDGAWTALLPDIPITPLRPANCGFTVAWSDIFRRRFEGTPLKRIAVTFHDQTVRGEALVTATGLEGGALYALSAAIRDASGPADITIDLRPDFTEAQIAARLDADRGSQSLSSFLRKSVGLTPVAIGLLQEALHAGATLDAHRIKALPVRLLAPQPIAGAISTAGGIALHAIDEDFMLIKKPGVFVAGEMLDWEAPTGGYLLQGALSSGVKAGQGVLKYLGRAQPSLR